jgi:hypothetical protein
MVAFRDRLRTSSIDRERYLNEKTRLAAQVWSDTNCYAPTSSPRLSATFWCVSRFLLSVSRKAGGQGADQPDERTGLEQVAANRLS